MKKLKIDFLPKSDTPGPTEPLMGYAYSVLSQTLPVGQNIRLPLQHTSRGAPNSPGRLRTSCLKIENFGLPYLSTGVNLAAVLTRAVIL